MTLQYPFVRELYDAFQTGEFDRWDVLVAEDVRVNSTMGRDIHGRDALKSWAKQFVEALQSRVDLVLISLMNLRPLIKQVMVGAFLPSVCTGSTLKNLWECSQLVGRVRPLKRCC